MDEDWRIVRSRSKKRTQGNVKRSTHVPSVGAYAILAQEALPDPLPPSKTKNQRRKLKKKRSEEPESKTPSQTIIPPRSDPDARHPPEQPVHPKVPSPAQLQPAQQLPWYLLVWSLICWLLPFLKQSTKQHPHGRQKAAAAPRPGPTQTGDATGGSDTPLAEATPNTAVKSSKLPAVDSTAVTTTPAPAHTAAAATAAAAAANRSYVEAATPNAVSLGTTSADQHPASAPGGAARGAGAAPQQQQDKQPVPCDKPAQVPVESSPGGRPSDNAATVHKGSTKPKSQPKSRFLLQHLVDGFNDVVGAVALSGNLLVATGYDSDVQLFRCPDSSNQSQGTSLPTRVKHLSGHTDRVQAVAVDQDCCRVVTAGRDAALKVWRVAGDLSGAKEASSSYLYEGVCCMEADWQREEVLLGGRSGATLIWSLQTSRRSQVLKGHSDEVTAVANLPSSPDMIFTGGRDRVVKLWDRRQPAPTANLCGLSGRVCSLAPGGTCLYVGDQSSSIKVFDLKALAGGGNSTLPQRQLPNAPLVAGEACPIAGLAVDAGRKLLLSSAMAWWSEDVQVMEEAAEDAEWPVGALNVFETGAVDGERYRDTLRLGSMALVSCMCLGDGGRLVVGDVRGGIGMLTHQGVVQVATGNEGGEWEVLELDGTAMGVTHAEGDSDGGSGSEGECGGSESEGLSADDEAELLYERVH